MLRTNYSVLSLSFLKGKTLLLFNVTRHSKYFTWSVLANRQRCAACFWFFSWNRHSLFPLTPPLLSSSSFFVFFIFFSCLGCGCDSGESYESYFITMRCVGVQGRSSPSGGMGVMLGSPPPPRWPAPEMEPDSPCSWHAGQGCVGTRRTLDTLSKVHHVNIITLDILGAARYRGLTRRTAIMGFIDGTKLGDVKILAEDVHIFKRLSELSPRCSLMPRTQLHSWLWIICSITSLWDSWMLAFPKRWRRFCWVRMY